MPSNEKRATNTCTNEINSDSSERKYVHLSNGLVQSFTRLECEYAQVAVDLFVIVIIIVIVLFKQGVRSAQADFQRSPVYITHIKQHN